MKDYYKILELDPKTTDEQIKTQHKLLLHAWHPDKFPEGDLRIKAHEKTIEINEAYNILGNATKRHSYDQEYKEKFQYTYSSNDVNQNSKEKVNTDYSNRTYTKASSTPKENAPTQSKNTSGKKIGILVFRIFVIIFLYYLYNIFSSDLRNQEIKQQTVNSPTNTLIPTRTLAPSFTPDPLASLRKRCAYWTDVDSSLLGRTICVFGEVVTFTPKEEIRVPAIGSEWIWYYYFSYENKDFFINHASIDKEFPDGYIGCIEVTGELKSDKTNALYLEIWSGSGKNWELLNDC